MIDFQPIKMGIKRVVFVSYFTDDYTVEAKRLAASLHKYGLEYDIEHIESKGSWTANTYFKPAFLLKKMEQYWDDYDVLCWLDADAELLDTPEEILYLDKDIGVCYIVWEGGKRQLCSGTLALTMNSTARVLLQAWVGTCSVPCRDVLEQEQLQNLLSEFPSCGIHCFDRRYIAIKGHGVKKPIVYHHQHSRETRRGSNL